MKEYQPNLISRPEYVRDRSTSEFRETIWSVIATLNPNSDKLLFQASDPELNIQSEHFPLPVEGFRTAAATQVVKAARAMQLIEQAIGLLEKVKSLRALRRVSVGGQVTIWHWPNCISFGCDCISFCW